MTGAQRLLSKARGRVRVCQPAIFPGDLVAWIRGDGSTQEGIVDFLHVDQDGQAWAFVALEGTWAAVRVKLLTLVRP